MLCEEMYMPLARAMMEKTSSGKFSTVRPSTLLRRRFRVSPSSRMTEMPVYMRESHTLDQLTNFFQESSMFLRTPPPAMTACITLRTPVMPNQMGAPNQASTHHSWVMRKVRRAGMKPQSTLSTLEKVVFR